MLCLTKQQGPVVQSIVSLIKAFVKDSLSHLVRTQSSMLIFFAETRNVRNKSSSHFFLQIGSVYNIICLKIWHLINKRSR